MVFADIMIDSIFSLPIANIGLRYRWDDIVKTWLYEGDIKFLWERDMPPQMYQEFIVVSQETPTKIFVSSKNLVQEKDIIRVDHTGLPINRDDPADILNRYMVIGVHPLQSGITQLDLQWQTDGNTA